MNKKERDATICELWERDFTALQKEKRALEFRIEAFTQKIARLACPYKLDDFVLLSGAGAQPSQAGKIAKVLYITWSGNGPMSDGDCSAMWKMDVCPVKTDGSLGVAYRVMRHHVKRRAKRPAHYKEDE